MCPLPCDPAALTSLDVLHTLQRQMEDVRVRLIAAQAAAAVLVDATRWETESARRFHVLADGWRGDVGALSALAESAAHDLTALQWRIWATGGICR